MNANYDYVTIGAGHNVLTAAAYMAAAGKRVLVLEHNDWWGGGVVTRELTEPGYLHDLHAAIHIFVHANPLIKDDELQLQSKFGLEYLESDVAFSAIFDDDSTFGIYRDRQRTLDSIGKFSATDAAAYDRFATMAKEVISLVEPGLFVPPIPLSASTAFLEQSDLGRDLLVLGQYSAEDVVGEWFQDERIKIALLKLTSELSLAHPREKTSGLALFFMLGLIEKYGAKSPVGGSGGLSDALVRSIRGRGGEVRTGVTVTDVILDGNKARGLRTADGEEILAREGVIGTIHPHHLGQYFPNIDPGILAKAKRTKLSPLSVFMIHAALDEPVEFRAGAEANNSIMNAFCSRRIEDQDDAFDALHKGGLPKVPLIGGGSPTRLDPTRAPDGKAILHLSALSTYNLADGGPKAWKARASSYADELINYVCKFTTNLSPEKLRSRFELSPLDVEEDSRSFVQGDVTGIATWNFQMGALRPIPELANYTIPGIDGFYLAGPTQHPGPGVSGGGRAVAVKILADQGTSLQEALGTGAD